MSETWWKGKRVPVMGGESERCGERLLRTKHTLVDGLRTFQTEV